MPSDSTKKRLLLALEDVGKRLKNILAQKKIIFMCNTSTLESNFSNLCLLPPSSLTKTEQRDEEVKLHTNGSQAMIVAEERVVLVRRKFIHVKREARSMYRRPLQQFRHDKIVKEVGD